MVVWMVPEMPSSSPKFSRSKPVTRPPVTVMPSQFSNMRSEAVPVPQVRKK